MGSAGLSEVMAARRKRENRAQGAAQGAAKKRPGRHGHLARLHASLSTALSLLDPEKKDEAGPDLPFRSDATAFAIAVDSLPFFGVSGENALVPAEARDEVRSVAETAGRLAGAIEALQKPAGADARLLGSLRHTASILARLRKKLDLLCCSWIVADLCLLALIGRAMADGGRLTAGEAGPTSCRSSAHSSGTRGPRPRSYRTKGGRL